MKRGGYQAMIALLILGSCATQRKLDSLREERLSARIELPQRVPTEDFEFKIPPRDTLRVVDFDGHEVMIMKAVRDEDGEMVATDVLDAAYVTAKFRNIAERHGRVDLHFDVIVPPDMQDSKWQLRFRPHLEVLGECSDLDPVLITGSRYRQSQLRGYQQYERFLQRIVSDTTRFIDIRALEIFLKRNIPDLYALKKDTTIVGDDRFNSIYGVNEAQALSHYTDQIALKRNNWRKGRKDKMYRKYVKSPIRTTGLKLDTVIADEGGRFVYEYVQTIQTRPGLRNARIWMDGEIYDQDRKLYSIPSSDSLTFYISSISTFADKTEKYLDKVIERKVMEEATYHIAFPSGGSEIDESLGENEFEIHRIKDNLARLLEENEFLLDSICITASCSPEGAYAFNDKLARKRSKEACQYFNHYIKSIQDSIVNEHGIFYDELGIQRETELREISFSSSHVAENWELLNSLVSSDSSMTAKQKERYFKLCGSSNLDKAERAFHSEEFYPHFRKDLYPMLRTVQFKSFMSRKGMVKDTIHTSVLDTAYMSGIKALEDRDYETAISLLRPYGDYNLAVAYCALDYNASAMAILSQLPENAMVDYLLALLFVRQGDEEKAVERYIKAVNQNRSYIHRGNLDPEISALIKKYQINFETDY